MKIKSINLFLLLIPNHGFGQLLVNSIVEPIQTESKQKYQWCNSSYVGYAWPMKAGVQNPDVTKFNKVAPGDSDDLKLSNVSYAGISLGRQVCDWLILSASYEIYNSFNYQNYHQGGYMPTDLINPVDFMRIFTVVHQSILANGYFDLPAKAQKEVGTLILKPVLGAGLGVAINQMTSFQTLTFVGSPQVAELSTFGMINFKNSLAWYLNLGLSFQPKGTSANFGFGYRYYSGGTFASSSKYVINDADQVGRVELRPWTGKIKTNQLKLFLDFSF